jgi:hypothetical protein
MTIPDFTTSEQQLVNQILLERYSRIVPLQSADVELQLDTTSAELSLCPALYWSALGCEFIISKVGNERFRCQFFYSANEQFGTGRDVYDNLGDCVTTLLRLQADHSITRSTAMTEFPDTGAREKQDDYLGPLVI